MSIAMMDQVGDLNAPSNLKFVLLKYADNADQYGRDTWPSRDVVARYTSLSPATVKRAVGYLRAQGILVEQATHSDGRPPAAMGGRGRRGRGMIYSIDMERARDLFGYWRKAKNGTVKLIGGKAEKGARDDPGISESASISGDEKGGHGAPGLSEIKGGHYEPGLSERNGGHGAPGLSERKGGHHEPGNCEERGVSQSERGVSQTRKGGHDAAAKAQETAKNRVEPPYNHPNPVKRARDAAAVDNSGAARASHAPPQPLPPGGAADPEIARGARGGKRRPWEALPPGRLEAAIAARRAERGGSLRLASITESERAAADAYIAAVLAGEIADAPNGAGADASDALSAHAQRLRDVLGERDYRTWVLQLTPIEDDGETLAAAAPTKMIADVIMEKFAVLIEGVIGRRLRVAVRPLSANIGYASAARGQR